MPKVGSGKNAKKFAYTEAGEAAAESYAKKTGQKVQYTKPMKKTTKKGSK